MRRREFLRRSGAAAGAVLLLPTGAFSAAPSLRSGELFRISLAQWSLHRTIFAGELDPFEFPAIIREQYELDAVEYVNTFYRDHATDPRYFARLARHADEAGVRSLLIMCDGEGALGDPDAALRARAVDNHRKWLDAAARLGCHSIRVNVHSQGTYDEQLRLAADGLRRLAELGDDHGLDVIVENHGGLSSNGAWLAAVVRAADHPRAGTLPDFGNFRISTDPEEWYDRYQGVAELMPFARGVSAKSHEFDERGEETGTDFTRMMRIVLDAGYRGYVGIEYEGDGLSEHEGILATNRLLECVRTRLAPQYQAG